MNKKTFILIIVLMSIALAGTVSVQILWMRNAVKIQEKQFEQNVFASLKTIVAKLGIQSTIVKLSAEFLDLDDRTEKIYNDSIKTQSKITIFALDTEKNDSVVEINDLEKFFKKLKIEIKETKDPLQKLNLNLLDTIIKNELKERGINSRCEFAAVHKTEKGEEIKYKSKNFKTSYLKSKFKTNIFITDADYFLVLYFPDKSKYIYKSVVPLLLLSVFFTLIILATFIITVNVILKQKKLSEIKTDFINNITHELKTPVATLKVAISTLKQDKTISENKTVMLLERQGNRLQKITERVIDSSFNNKPNINAKKINVHKYFEYLITDFKHSINDKNITVSFKSKVPENLFAKIDETYLTPAIINILDNAVKYNDKEHKEVSVTVFSKDNFLFAEIKDNGTGIAEKDKKMIFEKFYRGMKGNIHKVKGLGIGLFFTKQITEIHGGTVYFESKKGEGTKFTVKLPAETL
ncbi:MAG: HAMP domain-containing histidine kinase [Chlorobi bacterium]|nr:HAMP domain-containing histidine kinase [Chlorobiota bacterium]